MTDDDKALVERLRALHVWPQSIADGHAELLTPRQIDKLYEVGAVSHEAADRIEALSAENERLREALRFYANTPCNLEFGVVNVCPYDDGDIARAALGDTK